MNWEKLATALEGFSIQCAKDARNLERRYPAIFQADARALSAFELSVRDQVQRKLICAEIGLWAEHAVREGLRP